jgi:RNA polymerase sigma-70 factor (ECF subfamily)
MIATSNPETRDAERALAGDATIDFDELAGRHRRALHVHCYRMVGSFTEAEDLVQETLLRAWKARDTFDARDGELGMRRWLYRIATNACLDHLRSPSRRVASYRSFAEIPWIQPYPDRLLDDLPADQAAPDAALVSKETIALGYLALIQLLPPRQRAVFVLRDVLGWSAAETASLLELSVAAANSSLQRARETIARHTDARGLAAAAAEPSDDERAVLTAFIEAHESGDAAASAALLSQDVRVTMPPQPVCYEGAASLIPLIERAAAMGEWRLVPAWANRQPAAVSYLRRPGDTELRALKIDVLRIRDGLIHEITTFDASLVEAFGLPAILR